jgi:predicted TIM-barrel fold metal-dependent hydrolase
MGRIIDADSHFMEPLDLWERYIDPPYRSRCLRFRPRPDKNRYMILVGENTRARFNVEDFLGVVAGFGQKEQGIGLGEFDLSAVFTHTLEDMEKRIAFLDAEGFERQFLFPSLGLLLDGLVEDPELAAAHCRAYNTWALDLCAGYRQQLHPVGHVSLRHPAETVRELRRLAKAGVRGVFIGAMPVAGKSFGHPDFDPIWAAAQELDLAICIHLVVHPYYLGNEWHKDPNPGFMYVSLNVIQDPRMALTTMVYDGVFERFPRLRVATIESSSGWVVEWIDRLDYRYSYMGHTTQMKRSASEYFARNIWISADPEERSLPYMVELVGDDKFFIGSDYPHAEGFVHPVEKARHALRRLPATSVDKILGDNAARFFGV